MKKWCILFLLLRLFSGSSLLNAQANFRLEIQITEGKLPSKFSYQEQFTSSESRQKGLQKIIQDLWTASYLTAGFDSIVNDSLTLRAYLHIGPAYQWAQLSPGNTEEYVWREIGFNDRLFTGKAVNFKEIARLQERIIRWYENHGYPFVSVQLDSLKEKDNGNLSAALVVEKHTLFHIDSIAVKGNASISNAFLYHHLNLHPGDIYNEQSIRELEKRLMELPFIRITQPPLLQFIEQKVKVFLFIDKKNASQFDGYIGILPNNKNDKILLTGDLRLRLLNSLSQGELLDLNWRRLQAATQDLKAHVNYPFLFSTSFGVDYHLKIYKKDTSFIDINNNLGVQYALSGGSFFKVFVNNRQSNLLSTDGLQQLTVLPDYADINTTLYGFGFRSEKLDYRLNPRKGYSLSLNGSAGNRTIQKNARLNPVIYENVKLKTAQYSSELEMAWFVPVKRRSTIKFSTINGWIESEKIFSNELLRIGGLKTLRGFDEESIWASAYSIVNAEYRFLLEQNSYLYGFFNAAYYENKAGTTFIHDTPFGFGAGISFETKAGIFSINYALGKQFDNPISPKSGKIHFGIVNSF